MAHSVEEVGLHLVCVVRTLESLFKGLLLARLVLNRVVDIHEHAHARARDALLVASELRGGADPHALAVLAPHAIVDVVQTALRCGDAELLVDTGKIVRGDEPVRVLAVFREVVPAFEAEHAAALVGEPESRGVAFVIEVSGPAGGMHEIANVGRFPLEGVLGKSALLLFYLDVRLGKSALRPTGLVLCLDKLPLRPAQLLHEQPFALLAICNVGEVETKRGIPFPRLGFRIVVHIRPPITSRYVPLPYGLNEKPPTR